ncbi:hypothetical protein FQP90_19210 [Paenarthrobacter nitroguajacolicus]|uniref:Uncharacterized protein n=1 Tax=Paenarthrobacter nitroguajacolicus TaxID=211146 RepID=A0A558GRL2_PAENT|nr:hypothetical protein [Paenarthrobacter nitroguajacolicus]TVU59527.1 hypothetical protein FQP90_19210 [Paenarthrobacter nitroguajacolicus]
MPHELRMRLKTLRVTIALFWGAAFLTACTPAATENPMAGSSNPSDPAAVKAQVEELQQALKDLQAFKTETQKAIGPQKWVDKGTRSMDCRTSDGQRERGHLLSYFANLKGSGLEVNSACVVGDQHEIYEELDRQEASASPSPITK